MIQTGMRRTLWRTHSVVCRRCKANAESLRQTDRDAWLICAEQSFLGCAFLFTEIMKEVITDAFQTY